MHVESVVTCAFFIRSIFPLAKKKKYSNLKPMSKPARRPVWTLVRCTSHEDMRSHAIRRWQQVSATARAEAAWEMVEEAWSLKKRPADELRLQRTITVLRKA